MAAWSNSRCYAPRHYWGFRTSGLCLAAAPPLHLVAGSGACGPRGASTLQLWRTCANAAFFIPTRLFGIIRFLFQWSGHGGLPSMPRVPPFNLLKNQTVLQAQEGGPAHKHIPRHTWSGYATQMLTVCAKVRYFSIIRPIFWRLTNQTFYNHIVILPPSRWEVNINLVYTTLNGPMQAKEDI